jgi:exodeoxyribonuclease V alpha subunit
MGKTWDAQQLDAIDQCCDLTRRIVAITGKAGSGKTSIIEEVYGRLTRMGYTVACCTPTGKAAKRVYELTGIHAETNHRLLGYGMPFERKLTDHHTLKEESMEDNHGPKYKKSRPLEYDFLLCDEYAMVNWSIHRALVDALKPGARMRLFGDINQIRPIEEDQSKQDEASAFFMMLKKFHGIELTTQHRQLEGSGIQENANNILRGVPIRKRDDFVIKYTNAPVSEMLDTVKAWRERGVDYSSVDNQIITTQNVSWIGTIKLNAALQAVFWDSQHEAYELPRWTREGQIAAPKNAKLRVQVGSKIVYTANTYSFGNGDYAFNGEIGIVTAIEYDGSMTLDLGDRIIHVPSLVVIEGKKGRKEFDPRKNIDLAYALTTHKMQGSEARHTIYMLNKSTLFSQSRRNFYTGVTRARQHCTIITDQQSMKKSLNYMG